MEGDTMTEQVMTAQELAEARELEQAATAGPWEIHPDRRKWVTGSAPDEVWQANRDNDASFVAAARTLVPRLLATVDALTARIYELEDLLLSAIVTAERDTYAEQLAEALALLGEHREALGWIAQQACEYQVGDGEVCLMTSNCVTEWCLPCYAKQSLTLTAPEALRQQQEREAEKDALIEALRGALAHCQADAQGRGDTALRMIIDHALSLTPPQALREREERVAALEKVADSAHRLTVYPSGAVDGLGRLSTALKALDATKGGR